MGVESQQVHIVDDDELQRAILRSALSGLGFDAAEYASGEAFLANASASGVVLLDIEMPGLSGLDVLSRMAEAGDRRPVVVLTARNDFRTAVEAMKRGAFEFLDKPSTAEALDAALSAAFAKLAANEALAEEPARARALVERLTPRELDVLRGLLAGMPSKGIAHALGLSVRTAEVYRGRVMNKLEARNLSPAIRLALAAGVAPLGPSEPCAGAGL